jgi:hypothetical protein
LRTLQQDTLELLRKVRTEKESFTRHTGFLISNLRALRNKEHDRHFRVADLEGRVKALEKRLPKQQPTGAPSDAIKKPGMLDRWVSRTMDE